MYVGIIIAPFLMIHAITGSVYLFKPQVEKFLYDDYYTVADQGEKLIHSKVVDTVKEEFPNSDVNNYRPCDAADRSAEVKINDWWPRKMRMAGVFYPRLKSRKRTFIRVLHVVPGF